MSYINWDNEEEEHEPSKNRYIEKSEAKPDNKYHSQEYPCPNCGSYNTGQSTYADYCNTCGWGTQY